MAKENNSNDRVNDQAPSIVIDVAEHEKFDHIMDAKYMTSVELCTWVNNLLKTVYADYEGSHLVVNNGQPMINLYFNHRGTRDNGSDLPFACSKEVESNRTLNSTLRATRMYQSRLINGDKFYLTKEGTDGLGEFIMEDRSIHKNNGDINWGKVVTDVADPVGGMGIPMQYTQVSFIDPVKMVEKIVGKVDDDGTTWIYGVRVMRSIPRPIAMNNGNANAEFMLAVERVCESELNNLARSFGLNLQSGLNIIR